ncbi:MAG: branched-chain amino acid ABC transporter permease [Clostridia bacterium]|nr:branched-chain amino acid ABC transporter permease [Clostridia bacterium]
MTIFLSTLMVGLRLGSIYALIAIGYTMVYGIIRMINFAHGDFIMVGGYTLVFTMPVMTEKLGLPAWTGVVFAVIVCAIVGVLVELLAYRPVRKKGTGMSALITAIAMSLILENLAQAIPAIGPNPKIPQVIFPAGSLTLAGVAIDMTTIYTILVAGAMMVLLTLLVKKTSFGRAMRAVSENKKAAVLMGVNVDRTILLTFAIGASLAAVAALMYIAQYPLVFTTIGSSLGLKAFVAAVLGGIGSLPGAMLGGLIIGMAESFTVSYISSAMADTFVYLILIIVLLIRPVGILGKNVREKV